MKLKYKFAIWAVVIDLLLYLLIFHFGITQFFVDHSMAGNNGPMNDTALSNSLPQLVWISLHFPLVWMITLRWVFFNVPREIAMLFLILQTGIIFYCIGAFVDYRIKKKLIN